MATPTAEQRPIATKVIDNIDLDDYDDQCTTLRLEVLALCRRLPFVGETSQRAKRFCQHDVLKKLETEYLGRLREERTWSTLLMSYSQLSRRFTELRDDPIYHLSAVRLIAVYIDHKCEMFRFQAQKFRDHVEDCCSQLWTLMKVILYDSVELKTMVLLHTKMTPENAFLQIILLNGVKSCAINRIHDSNAAKRMSAVILVNAIVLMLNRWYQLMPSVQQVSFHKDMRSFVQRLTVLRSQFGQSRPVPNQQFYERFIGEFETSALRDLYTNAVTNAAIGKFSSAYVAYWNVVNMNPDAYRLQRPPVQPSTQLPATSTVIDISDDDDDHEDNTDRTTPATPAPAMQPAPSPLRRRSSSNCSNSSTSISPPTPQVCHETHKSATSAEHLSQLTSSAQSQDSSDPIATGTTTTSSTRGLVAASRSLSHPCQNQVGLDTDRAVESLRNTHIGSASPAPQRQNNSVTETAQVVFSVPASQVPAPAQVCSIADSAKESAGVSIEATKEDAVQVIVSETISTARQSPVGLDKHITNESLQSTSVAKGVETEQVVVPEQALSLSTENQVGSQEDIEVETEQVVVAEPTLSLSSENQVCSKKDSAVESLQSAVDIEMDQAIRSEPDVSLSQENQVCSKNNATVVSLQLAAETVSDQNVVSEPALPLSPQDEDKTVDMSQSATEPESTKLAPEVLPETTLTLPQKSQLCDSSEKPKEHGIEAIETKIDQLVVTDPTSLPQTHNKVCLEPVSTLVTSQKSIVSDTTKATEAKISKSLSTPASKEETVILPTDSAVKSLPPSAKVSLSPETEKVSEKATKTDSVAAKSFACVKKVSTLESSQKFIVSDTTKVTQAKASTPAPKKETVILQTDCAVKSLPASAKVSMSSETGNASAKATTSDSVAAKSIASVKTFSTLESSPKSIVSDTTKATQAKVSKSASAPAPKKETVILQTDSAVKTFPEIGTLSSKATKTNSVAAKSIASVKTVSTLKTSPKSINSAATNASTSPLNKQTVLKTVTPVLKAEVSESASTPPLEKQATQKNVTPVHKIDVAQKKLTQAVVSESSSTPPPKIETVSKKTTPVLKIESDSSVKSLPQASKISMSAESGNVSANTTKKSVTAATKSIALKSDTQTKVKTTPKAAYFIETSIPSALNVPKSNSQAIHNRPSVIASNSSKGSSLNVTKTLSHNQPKKTCSDLEQTPAPKCISTPITSNSVTAAISVANTVSSPIASKCGVVNMTVNTVVLDRQPDSKEKHIVSPPISKERVTKVKKTKLKKSAATSSVIASLAASLPPTITSAPTPVKIQKAVYSIAAASTAQINRIPSDSVGHITPEKTKKQTPPNASVIATPEATAKPKSPKVVSNPTPVKLTRAIGYAAAEPESAILPSPTPAPSPLCSPPKQRKTVRFDDRLQDCTPSSIQKPLPVVNMMHRKSSLKTSVITSDPPAESVEAAIIADDFNIDPISPPVQPKKVTRKIVRNPVVRLKKLTFMTNPFDPPPPTTCARTDRPTDAADNPVERIPNTPKTLTVHECAATSVITKDTSSRPVMTQARPSDTVNNVTVPSVNVGQPSNQPSATPTNTINPPASLTPPTQPNETICRPPTPHACIRPVSPEPPANLLSPASIADSLPDKYPAPLSTTDTETHKEPISIEPIERPQLKPVVEKPVAPSAPVQNIEISSSTHGDTTHRSPEGTPNASTDSSTPSRTEPDSSGAAQVDGSPTRDEVAVKESENENESVTSDETASNGSGTPQSAHVTDTQPSSDGGAGGGGGDVSEPKAASAVAVDSDNSTASDDNCSKSGGGTSSSEDVSKTLPLAMDSVPKPAEVEDQVMADENRSNCSGTPLNDEDRDNLMVNPEDLPVPVYGLFGVDVSNDPSDSPTPSKKARFGQSAAATVRVTGDVKPGPALAPVAPTPTESLAKTKAKGAPVLKRTHESASQQRSIAAQPTVKNIVQNPEVVAQPAAMDDTRLTTDADVPKPSHTSSAPKTVSDVDISDENLIQIQKDWFRYVNLLNTHSSPLTNCHLKPSQTYPISTDVCEQILGKPPQHALVMPSGSSSLGQIFAGSLSEDELQLQSLKPIKVDSPDQRPPAYNPPKIERKHKLPETSYHNAPPVKRSKSTFFSSEWSKEIALFDRHFGMLPASCARPNRIASILNENVPKTAAPETVHALLLAQMYFIQCAVDPFRRFEPKKVHFVDEMVKRSESTFVALQTANDVENQYKRLKKSYLNRRAALPDKDSDHFNRIIDNTDAFLKQWTHIRHSIFKQKPSETHAPPAATAGPSSIQSSFDLSPPVLSACNAGFSSVDTDADSPVTVAASAVTHFPVDGEICSKLQLDDCYNLFEYNDFMQESSGSSTIQHHVNGDRLQSLVESQQADDVLLGGTHTRKQDGMISGLGFEYTNDESSKSLYDADPVQTPVHMMQTQQQQHHLQQQATVPLMPTVQQPRPQAVLQPPPISMPMRQTVQSMPVRVSAPSMMPMRQTVTLTVQPIVPMPVHQQQPGLMATQRSLPLMVHPSTMPGQMLLTTQHVVVSMAPTVARPATSMAQRSQPGPSRDTGTAQRVLPIQRSPQVRKPETWDCFKRLPRSKVPTVKTAK